MAGFRSDAGRTADRFAPCAPGTHFDKPGRVSGVIASVLWFMMAAMKTFSASHRIGGLVLGGVVAFSCGDGSGSSAFVPESVNEDEPVRDLDPTEQEAFCKEAIAWARGFLEDTLPRLLCRTEGLSAGGTEMGFDASACEAAERDCLTRPADDDDAFDADELSCNLADLTDVCDATVGEYADCFSQAAGLSKRLLAEVSCQSVAAGNVPDQNDYQLSAACQSLLAGCGGATDEMEGDAGSESGLESGSGSEPGTGDAPGSPG